MVKKMVKQQTKASINIKDNSRRVIGSSKKSVNRGVWSAEEDQKLFHYVKLHGEKKWKSLPEKAGLNRLGKSCRLRWLNYLRPGIKRGKLSEDEEDLIMRLHNLLGNRWSLIAARLPGRTDNEIKNHWNSHLSKKSLTIHELNLKMNGTLESKKDTHNSAPPTCSTSLAAATSPSLVENSPYPHHSFEGFDDMETLTPMSVSSIRTEFDSDVFFDFSGDLDLLRSDPVGDRSELGVLQEDHNNKLFDQGMYQYFLDTELQINISNTTESLDGNQQCWNQLDVDQLVQLLDSNERDGMDPSPSLHSQSQGNGNSNVVN